MLYLFFLLPVVIFFVVILARTFRHWKSPMGIGSYAEGLRNENNGHFEAAITAYEAALVQCKKIRFKGVFRNKIIGKVKLLHTVIDYRNNSIGFIR